MDALSKLGEGILPPGFGPAPSPLLRRSVLDDVTGQPVITSAPTGEVRERAFYLPLGRNDSGRTVPAVPGMIANAPMALVDSVTDAANLVPDAWNGRLETQPSAMGLKDGLRIANAAGMAMTGSMPLSAPKGALRAGSALGKEADPLAALEAALGKADIAPVVTPRSFVDPAAKSWDLYHGTAAPTDFQRFRTGLPDEMRPNTLGSASQGDAVFFTPAPDEAAHYALGRGATGEGAEAGPRSLRVTMDPGKTGVFDLPHLIETDPAFRETMWQTGLEGYTQRSGVPSPDRVRELRAGFDRNMQSALDDIARTRAFNDEHGHLGVSETPQVNYFTGGADAAIRQAREQGLDTAIIRGLSESNGGDQVVALTPNRVRSYYDPDHVLYSGGNPAFGLAALGAPDDAQAAYLPPLPR